MIKTDKIEECIVKEQVGLKINKVIFRDFRLEVQKKFGKTRFHLGESLEEALEDWIQKQKLTRKQKKKGDVKK